MREWERKTEVARVYIRNANMTSIKNKPRYSGFFLSQISLRWKFDATYLYLSTTFSLFFPASIILITSSSKLTVLDFIILRCQNNLVSPESSSFTAWKLKLLTCRYFCSSNYPWKEIRGRINFCKFCMITGFQFLRLIYTYLSIRTYILSIVYIFYFSIFVFYTNTENFVSLLYILLYTFQLFNKV